jgi:hypothetical protein
MDQIVDILMDFVGPLPKSRGYDALLVITDRLTGYTKIEPTTKNFTACEAAAPFHPEMHNLGSVSVRSGPTHRTNSKLTLDRTNFRPILD